MYLFCVLLTMTRYVLVEVVIQLLPRRKIIPAVQEAVTGDTKRKVL